MKTAEKILACLVGISLLLKLIDDITWAAVATVLSLTLMAVFYLFGSYFLFRQRGNKDPKPRGLIIPSIMGGFILFITILGMLFLIMYWTGAVNLLAIGIAGCAILAFVSLRNYRRSKVSRFLHLSTRLLIFGTAGLLSLLASVL